LTCIQPDKKAIETRTFYQSTIGEMRKWLELYNGQRNLYFQINPVKHKVTKKAARTDIKSVNYFHIDIDPESPPEDSTTEFKESFLESEKQRCLGLLTDKLPEGIPEPTIIIYSGGGYQGFWELNNPIPIDGKLELAEDAKRYNQQLETVFQADHCHNIDRLCRLPGTLNVPDAKKRKKGRKIVLAEVHKMNMGMTYDEDAFQKAPEVQVGKTSISTPSSVSVEISGNIERVDDVNDLDLRDRTKIIIVQGRLPDERKEDDDSRSAWLFDALCGMARAGFTDDKMYSIITDPEFGISESVIDKGANAHKYATRQIARAKEHVIDPWLEKLNKQFAVIRNMGGKCRVIEEVYDQAMKRTRFTKMSFQDFAQGYCNKKIQVGVDAKMMPIMMPVGKWWINHELRRQYNSLVFSPGADTPGHYNLWKGFGCQAIAGDCSLYLDHIKKNICGGDEEIYIYVISWLARGIQFPDRPGEVALVLKGKRGVGKGVFANEYLKLFGRHGMQIVNSSHLVGNFNSHLRDVVCVFADEAFYANDKKNASVLKALITEPTLTIEAKGIDAEACPNYISLIMASNEDHVVPAGGDERRYCVIDVKDTQQQNSSYFAAIRKQMDSGGQEALLHYLLNYDISEFQVRKVPQTKALMEQKMLSMTVEQEWWFNKLQKGQIFEKDKSSDQWLERCESNMILDDYINHTKRLNVARRACETSLGLFLRKICPGIQTRRVQENFTRTRFHYFPDLKMSRAFFAEAFGPIEWETIDADFDESVEQEL